eukprot:3750723-Prymnesium_polylepis.1
MQQVIHLLREMEQDKQLEGWADALEMATHTLVAHAGSELSSAGALAARPRTQRAVDELERHADDRPARARAGDRVRAAGDGACRGDGRGDGGAGRWRRGGRSRAGAASWSGRALWNLRSAGSRRGRARA